jgi:hypothetical protein
MSDGDFLQRHLVLSHKIKQETRYPITHIKGKMSIAHNALGGYFLGFMLQCRV